MRCASALALALLSISASLPTADTFSAVHQQRYSMGTMFDVLVYHASRPDAERVVSRALDEVVRLDRVMSHFRPDSDLSRLVDDAANAFKAVDASLYDVIHESIRVSRASGGTFDVTVGPLVKLWRTARDQGRRPSNAEIHAARRCVGYERIEMRPPDRIRLGSDCIEIDLGGIGKGYAVDRAMRILKDAGIQRAVVNAGRSSIASIGAPPGNSGWPVTVGSASSTLLLHDESISTSQQNGEILEPATGIPAASTMAVSVVAPDATLSDALATTLLLLSREEGVKLLERFAGVSALWISSTGELKGAYRRPRAELSDDR
jgi:thiamine biosynthesis lipoprotein